MHASHAATTHAPMRGATATIAAAMISIDHLHEAVHVESDHPRNRWHAIHVPVRKNVKELVDAGGEWRDDERDVQDLESLVGRASYLNC